MRQRETRREREKIERVCVGLHIIITDGYLRHRRHGHNVLHLNIPYWSYSGQHRDQCPPSRAPREFFWSHRDWLISLGDKRLGSLEDTQQLVGLFLSMTVILLYIPQTSPGPRTKNSGATNPPRPSHQFFYPLFWATNESKCFPSQNFQSVFKKHYISSASERAFPGFFGHIFGCSTLSKERCFSTQEFTRFLSTVSSQRWAVISRIWKKFCQTLSWVGTG